MSQAERIFTDLMDEAGVQIGGPEPWDVTVNDERMFSRVLRDKSLGLGETYMAGWWDCERIDQLIDRVLRAQLSAKVEGGWRLKLKRLRELVLNMQSRSRAKIVAEHHYDLDNDLFGSFLDPHRQYSCGYFKDTRDLDRAQEDKLRLICEKLGLSEGDRLLDIGCGWGGLAAFAAQRYGCEVVGLNISREQIDYAREWCAGLPVEIRNQDYREVDEDFDKIVSVGMFEHVGVKNYDAFMDAASRCLTDDGVMLLHTIGSNTSSSSCDPWITRYIFPNGCVPSIAQIAGAAEGRLMMEDWHNFGPDYDKTLMCWLDNFRTAWPRLADRYDATFRRMWEYYLQSCAGSFRARENQLWQIVFTRPCAGQPMCRVS